MPKWPVMSKPPFAPRPQLPISPGDLPQAACEPPHHNGRAILPINLEGVQSLLDLARTGDNTATINQGFENAGWDHQINRRDVFLMAIDAETGNSTLHAAASTCNMEAMRAITGAFGPNLSQRWAQGRLYYLLARHQNNAGDTALHTAATQADPEDLALRAVISVYRVFHRGGCLTRKPGYIRRTGRPLSSPSTMSTTLTSTPMRWCFSWLEIRKGRTAAEEARAVGRDSVADWLDGVVGRLDPDGRSFDEVEMRRLERVVDEDWRYTSGNKEVVDDPNSDATLDVE